MDFPFTYQGYPCVVYINVDNQLDISLAQIEELVLDAIAENVPVFDAEVEAAERIAARIDLKL